MSDTLSTRRLFTESIPIAVTVLFWVVLSWFANFSLIANGVRYAGVTMALFLAVHRGLSLGQTLSSDPVTMDVEAVLRENIRVALPAGSWFLAAFIVYVIDSLWASVPLPGLFTSPANAFAFAFTVTGVATVVLYAAAVGRSSTRDDSSFSGNSTVTAISSDDYNQA